MAPQENTAPQNRLTAASTPARYRVAGRRHPKTAATTIPPVPAVRAIPTVRTWGRQPAEPDESGGATNATGTATVGIRIAEDATEEFPAITAPVRDDDEELSIFSFTAVEAVPPRPRLNIRRA